MKIYIIVILLLIVLFLIFKNKEPFSSKSFPTIESILRDSELTTKTKIQMIKRMGITDINSPLLYNALYNNKLDSDSKVIEVLKYI